MTATFTKKQYEFLAAHMRRRYAHMPRAIWCAEAIALATALARDSAVFNYDKFLTACSTPDEAVDAPVMPHNVTRIQKR